MIYLNYAARLMIAKVHPNLRAAYLRDIFSDQAMGKLAEAAKKWTDLSPAENNKAVWTVHSSEHIRKERKVFILLEEEHKRYSSTSVVRRLLGLPDLLTRELPINGHLLVIDNQESVRRISADVLRDFYCICHTARNHDEAIRLFVHDPDIKYVILDYEMQEVRPGDFVRIAKNLRPETHIIGTSSGEHKLDFSDLGVDTFLPKPWMVDDLVSAIGGHPA